MRQYLDDSLHVSSDKDLLHLYDALLDDLCAVWELSGFNALDELAKSLASAPDDGFRLDSLLAHSTLKFIATTAALDITNQMLTIAATRQDKHISCVVDLQKQLSSDVRYVTEIFTYFNAGRKVLRKKYVTSRLRFQRKYLGHDTSDDESD